MNLVSVDHAAYFPFALVALFDRGWFRLGGRETFQTKKKKRVSIDTHGWWKGRGYFSESTQLKI